jgi:ParB family chromosome partitioning protein
LQELAESVKAQGVVQPILVRAIDDGRYEIIAGERRWRASQMAGLESIPAVVRDVPDQSVLAIALIENIQRENLNPLEEAAAYSRLVNEFELTHAQVAEAVGKSRTTVTNLLRLLELGEDIKRLLESGDLEMGHARALLALQGETRGRAAREVVANGLSVRETETLVRRLQTPDQPTGPAPRPNPDVARLQNDLSERIGARVQIRHGSRGKGTLKIDYNSLDELEGILAHIR